MDETITPDANVHKRTKVCYTFDCTLYLLADMEGFDHFTRWYG